MKRISTLLVSFVLLLSCLSLPAFCDTAKSLKFEISSNGENVAVVNAGDEITVDFTVENITDDDVYSITNLQNEIEFDEDFFEYTEGDVELVTAYFSKYADDYSWGAHRVILLADHSAGGTGKEYENRQLVARVTFKVKEGLVKGSSGKLENKACEAYFGATGFSVTTQDMTVFIGSAPSETYTLTYKDNNEVVGSDNNAAYGSKVKIRSALTNADKKFAGWEDSQGKIWQTGENYTVTRDEVFTAVWLEKVTLSFETNGADAIADKIFWEGDEVDLSKYTPSKDGHTFTGWFEDELLTKPITSITITGNTMVFAGWIENTSPTKQYTLTFHTNNGSAIFPITMDENSVIDLSRYVPTRNGYTFMGWFAESSLTTPVTSVTLTAHTTVYAKWKMNETGGGNGGSSGDNDAVTKYLITFQTNGGSAVDSVEKVRNTTVDLSKYITTRQGYDFDGWCTDKELRYRVTEIKMTRDVTLYAKWLENGEVKQEVQPDYRPDILTKEHIAYINGRDGGYVYPKANLTRAEAATIFFRLLNDEVRYEGLTRKNSFKDVNEGDWFNTAVSTLANLGVLNGRTDDIFAPNATITRAEFTTIIARMSDAKYTGENKFVDITGHWAKDYINIAASIGWVNGENGIFRPDDNITRAEVMTLINRALNRQPESVDDLLENMFTAPDNNDTEAWYYIAIQEATNTHGYKMKDDGKHEKWTILKVNPNWESLEN